MEKIINYVHCTLYNLTKLNLFKLTAPLKGRAPPPESINISILEIFSSFASCKDVQKLEQEISVAVASPSCWRLQLEFWTLHLPQRDPRSPQKETGLKRGCLRKHFNYENIITDEKAKIATSFNFWWNSSLLSPSAQTSRPNLTETLLKFMDDFNI